MKMRMISLLAVLILLAAAFSCKQVTSPFSPDPESKEQEANPENTDGDASSKSITKESGLINDERRDTGLHKNPQTKYDLDTAHVPSYKLLNEEKIQDKDTGSATSKDGLGNESNLQFKEKTGFKGISNPVEKNKKTNQELKVWIQPDKWNLNWEQSEGLVTVRIIGEGFKDIDPDSITLSFSGGDGLDEFFMSEIRGSSLMTKFFKKDALGLIADPQPGDTYEIGVTGEFKDGSSFGPLNDTIMIVGETSDEEEPDDEEEETELSLEIEPDEWSLSWSDGDGATASGDNGGGVVTAIISGEGYENIVEGSVVMAYGACGGADGLSAVSPVYEEKSEDSYLAEFLQSEAIGLIPDPEEGATHQIHVTGNLEGDETFCLSHEITIVAEEEEEEEESDEVSLSLDIKPDKWNIAWANDDDSDGEVKARIRGEGFREIDPASAIMKGPEGDEISPSETEFSGSFFQAAFSKKEAIGLISDPQVGFKYTIHVIGVLADDSPFDLSYKITIKGKRK
jgi:hypothetical protein